MRRLVIINLLQILPIEDVSLLGVIIDKPENADDCARVSREFHSLGPVKQSRTRELEMVNVQHPGKGRAKAKTKPDTCK